MKGLLSAAEAAASEETETTAGFRQTEDPQSRLAFSPEKKKTLE